MDRDVAERAPLKKPESVEQRVPAVAGRHQFGDRPVESGGGRVDPGVQRGEGGAVGALVFRREARVEGRAAPGRRTAVDRQPPPVRRGGRTGSRSPNAASLQPRSIAVPAASVRLWARPPGRSRASISRTSRGVEAVAGRPDPGRAGADHRHIDRGRRAAHHGLGVADRFALDQRTAVLGPLRSR